MRDPFREHGRQPVLIVFLIMAMLALAVVMAQDESDGDAGDVLFAANCTSCHGPDGGGGLGPALRGNERLEDTSYLVARIMRGGSGMPAFAGRLEPEQIIAVAQHVANSWGNSFGEVPAALAQGMWLGEADEPEELYRRNCSMCHMPGGGGFIGPRLAGNERLADTDFVVAKILGGDGGMPAFEGILGAAQVAALASHVRQSWGNRFGPVSYEQVEQREEQKSDQEGGQVGNVTTGAVDVGGARLYSANCASCHGPGGGGDVGPALAGNEELGDTSYLVSRIAMGGEGMPPFNLELSSEQVASIASHVRNSWVNESGAIEPQTAARLHGPDSEPARLFANECAGCHGFAGRGYRGPGPPLMRNANLADAGHVVRQILFGGANMPAFGEELSAEQVAELATYLRTKWGNRYGPVEVELVRRQARE